MNPVSSISRSTSTATVDRGPRELKDMSIDQFLKLIITELQNQDPLNPMNNTELLQQLGQIRQISSTTQLSQTLEAVIAGQNMATATTLIGKKVSALSNDQREVTGVVDRVSVVTEENTARRTVTLHIGDAQIRLENVREILE